MRSDGRPLFGSLFSGIGGIDLGLERAGWKCSWQVENDPYCNRVLEKHWPHVPRFKDVRDVGARELAPVDLICGGFPCQDLSQAGKRAGIEGSRSGLWFEFARIVGELRPRFVIAENVPGLLVPHRDGGWRPAGMASVVSELARLGYVGWWRSLRASEFGASHIRKRVFIVAYRIGECGERWRDVGIVGSAPGSQSSRAFQWQRDGYAAHNSGNPLAHGASGGFGELREPSECGGRFTDGRDAAMEIARCARSGRPTESSGLHGSGSSDHDSRASGALEDPARDEQQGLSGKSRGMRRRGVRIAGEQLDHANQGRESSLSFGTEEKDTLPGITSDDVPDADIPRLSDSGQAELSGAQRNNEGRTATELCGAFAPGPTDPRWPYILRERPDLAPALESPLRQLVDGFSSGLARSIELAMKDRIKKLGRLGNAVVPQVAEYIGRLIRETLEI